MQSIAAGWYPDPSGRHQARYWDGVRWTEHARDDFHAPATPSAPNDGVFGPAPPPGPVQTAQSPISSGTFPASPTGGLIAPAVAAPRLKPKGVPTAVFALILFGVLIAVVAATLFARTAALGAQMPGPSAEQVTDDFIAAAVAGDDEWRELALPTMVAEYDATASVPFLGTPGVLDTLGVRTSVHVIDLEFESDGKQVDNARVADRARASVTVAYAFTGNGAEQTVTTTADVVLSRPFYYDGKATPSEYRRSDTPTGAAPWRVLEVRPLGVATSSADAAASTSPCVQPGDVLVQLSNAARTTGELRVDCSLPSDGFLFNGDAAAVAARLPVMGEYSLPDDTMHLTGDTGAQPIAMYVIPTEGGAPIAAVMVHLPSDWRLLGIAEVAQ